MLYRAAGSRGGPSADDGKRLRGTRSVDRFALQYFPFLTKDQRYTVRRRELELLRRIPLLGRFAVSERVSKAPRFESIFASDFQCFGTTFPTPFWCLGTPKIDSKHFLRQHKKIYKNHCFSKVLATLGVIFLLFRTRENIVNNSRIGPRGPF